VDGAGPPLLIDGAAADTLSGVTAPVCVCIPAYQAGRFLRATLDSVLAQTFADFELVVLDNGSTDDTADVVAEYADPRLRFERNETVLPMAANWNHLVSLSSAPLIKVLCADDLIYPRCLETQVATMAATPSAALVACRRDLIDASGATVDVGGGLRTLVGVRTRTEVARAIVRHGGNPIGEPGSVLFRREAFEATGGFDDAKKLILDTDLWVRLLNHGDLVGQAESLAAFRLHEDSTTTQISVPQKAAEAALVHDLATSPEHGVRALDRLVGGMVAPLGRLYWSYLQSKAR